MATKKTTGKKSEKKITRELILFAVIVAVIVIVFLLLVYFGVIDLSAYLGEPEEQQAPGEKPASAELADIDLSNCIKIHFIDVGQGDSILVELDTDTILLIDAGHTGVSYSEEKGKYVDRPYGSGSVPKAVTEPYFAYLDEVINNHGGDIDYLVATHRDSDHINMLPKVLDRYQVNTVFYNDCYNESMTSNQTSATARNFETAVENEPDCTQYQFETADDTVIPIKTTNYTLTVYSSGNDGFTGARTKENSMSIICLLEYAGRKVLFTGDAEVETEEWFIDKTGNDANFDVDVLKVAHHGSESSSCEDFLDYVHAEYAVISSGKNNAYGHPRQLILDRLNERNMTIYNTQDDGTITLYIDYEGDICFVTENSNAEQSSAQ